LNRNTVGWLNYTPPRSQEVFLKEVKFLKNFIILTSGINKDMLGKEVENNDIK
jgi:hypothetical protein